MLSRGNMVQSVWVIALSGLALSAMAAGSGRIKITSSAFQQGENIPAKFTCDGGNHSPALQFHEIPSAARGLVLVVDDPDAPGGLFTHWLVWNIDPKTTTVAEGSTPAAWPGRTTLAKPVMADLAHRPGLIVISLGSSRWIANWI